MTSPKALLTGWNINAKKQLGQNFLSDPSTAEMIVNRAGIGPEETVLEIGAGLGAMTVPAAMAARAVYAVETDRRLIDLLKTELLSRRINNVEILHRDILKLEMDELPLGKEEKMVIIGNLPYNISSQILIRLIQWRHRVGRAILMFQKELAQRLAAAPGGKDYGRISVMIQYCADIRTITTIPCSRFFPKPKIDSSVLCLTFHHPPRHLVRNETFLFQLIKAAFSKRRKTLRNALKSSDLPFSHEDLATGFGLAGIDPVRRAETLSVEEFVRLSGILWTPSSGCI